MREWRSGKSKESNLQMWQRPSILGDGTKGMDGKDKWQ